MTRSTLRRLTTAVVATAAATLVGVGTSAATTHVPRPAAPTGQHVTSVSSTSFTVSFRASANATRYRLYASTLKSDLYYTNIVNGRSSSALRSATASAPSVAIRSLRYAAVPYYYRAEALNSSGMAFAPNIGTTGLAPARPTDLQVTADASGTSLTWNSGPATGFVIIRALDAGMTDDRHEYPIVGQTLQFTPTYLTPGTHYYFRVRAVNQSTQSGPTGAVDATPIVAQQAVTVMTYNILQLLLDGTSEVGGTISPWQQRKPKAAALIEQADPDVVSIQEGFPLVGDSKCERQVDSLAGALGGAYTVAETEDDTGSGTDCRIPRTGDYILYKPDVYTPVGTGGHWQLDTSSNPQWAAYQILQNTASGARFLFVATHLRNGDGDNCDGSSCDALREAETRSLLSQAHDYDADHGGVPIIYAGDFNSDDTPRHTFDGPGTVMRANDISDSRDVAQTHSNEQYDSVNFLYRTPPAFGTAIDHVYAPPGVGVSIWREILDLTDGKFVGTIPSDHNPVFTRVLYPYTPAG